MAATQAAENHGDLMLYRAIYDIMQTPQEEMRFSSFHFVALLLIDHDD